MDIQTKQTEHKCLLMIPLSLTKPVCPTSVMDALDLAGCSFTLHHDITVNIR